MEDATGLALDMPVWRLLAASRAACMLKWCKPNNDDDNDDNNDSNISICKLLIKTHREPSTINT